jgi:hypothetical protein
MQRVRVALIVGLALAAAACTKVYTDREGSSPTAPGRVGDYLIEYRVQGTAISTTIRYADSDNGMTQVVTGLPWSVRVRSNQAVLLVSLEVTPQSFSSLSPPFLVAQIYLDGVLLREASATTFLQPLSVSATVRR